MRGAGMASPMRYLLPLAVLLAWVLTPAQPVVTSAEDPGADTATDVTLAAAWFRLEPIPRRPDDEPGPCSIPAQHFHLYRPDDAPPSAANCWATTEGTPPFDELDCALEAAAEPTGDAAPLPVMFWVVSHCNEVDPAVEASFELEAGPEGAVWVRIEALSATNGEAEAAAAGGDGDGAEFDGTAQESPSTQPEDEEGDDDTRDDEDEPVGVDNDNDPPSSGSDNDIQLLGVPVAGSVPTYAVRVLDGGEALPEGCYVVTVLLHRDDGVRCLHLDGPAHGSTEED